jgi:hypothetical protein
MKSSGDIKNNKLGEGGGNILYVLLLLHCLISYIEKTLLTIKIHVLKFCSYITETDVCKSFSTERRTILMCDYYMCKCV